MYLGFALRTFGLAIPVDSAWMLLAVPIGLVFVDLIVIMREERYLKRSSERNISTINAVSGAGSSVHSADRILLTAIKY
jgi:hypothetical protein